MNTAMFDYRHALTKMPSVIDLMRTLEILIAGLYAQFDQINLEKSRDNWHEVNESFQTLKIISLTCGLKQLAHVCMEFETAFKQNKKIIFPLLFHRVIEESFFFTVIGQELVENIKSSLFIPEETQH